MQQLESPMVLTPAQALERYVHELTWEQAPSGRTVVLPGVIGTVFFERGSKPEVRQGLLACFDRFEQMFGEHLKGGKDADLGKFTKRTPKGLAKIRSSIIDTPPDEEVSVVRSSATAQDTAAEYEIKTLTDTEWARDFIVPGTSYLARKGEDEGMLSYVKFNVPMSLITTPEGLAQYESFLRFICQTLPVRGGYGGLSPILPFSFHRYMPQEWALAQKFSGLEIDSYAFIEKNNYLMKSHEDESLRGADVFYPYLHPGAKVSCYGFLKGVNWYTILGEPFVQRLGGEAAMRSALAREDIGIERVGQCVLVRAGPFPRLGAPEEGLPEPYVFVNRVLRVLRDPQHDALHSYIAETERADPNATLKWLARFDLPDAEPLPPTPTVVPACDGSKQHLIDVATQTAPSTDPAAQP